jgi:hypothetical protein
LNICEKKEKSIFHCQRKKNKPFFLKICVKYFVQKTKRTLLKTSCSKKSVASFGLRKEKEKQGFDVERFDLTALSYL